MMMMTIANNYRKALVGSASDDQSPAWPAPAAPPYTLFLIFIIIINIIIIIIIRLSEKSLCHPQPELFNIHAKGSGF